MAHDVPYGWAELDGVHVEGARIEAAFRRYFYRAVPRKAMAAADGGRAEAAPAHKPRHEYDIIVCHMNVIRYFLLRAAQLPPEAWLRFGGFNGGVTHIKISPMGNVSIVAFGDAGHLDLEQTTFGSHQGWECGDASPLRQGAARHELACCAASGRAGAFPVGLSARTNLE